MTKRDRSIQQWLFVWAAFILGYVVYDFYTSYPYVYYGIALMMFFTFTACIITLSITYPSIFKQEQEK